MVKWERDELFVKIWRARIETASLGKIDLTCWWAALSGEEVHKWSLRVGGGEVLLSGAAPTPEAAMDRAEAALRVWRRKAMEELAAMDIPRPVERPARVARILEPEEA